MKFMDLLKEEEKELPKIFCDMDSVLTDWNQAFEDISNGVDAQTYEKKNGKNSYWPLIAKEGEKFWSSMSWTKDGKQLWNFIKKYNPTILSSPTRDKAGHQSCMDGKKKWLKRELPGVPYIITNDKHKYANKDSILIDDYIDKIKLWKGSGGIPVHHKNTKDTIKQLKEIGFK